MNQSQEFNALLSHMQRWSSEEVFAAQEAVEALTRSPGWATVTRLLKQVHDHTMARLKHSAGSWNQADYAHALGKLAGMEVLSRVPEAVLLAAERAEKRLETKNAEMAEVA